MKTGFSAVFVLYAIISLMFGIGVPIYLQTGVTASVINPIVQDCGAGGCTSTTGTDTGYYPPPQQWFQYQTSYTVTDKIKVVVRIISDTGPERTGIGSFQISFDDQVAGSLTSGQTGDASVYAGTCYQQYIGEYYSGYTQYQGQSCDNVKRQHKVDVSVASSAAQSGDKPCPSGMCFYDPASKDIRYYLVSDKTQYKGDGETAEFLFKIEFRWYFATVDQNGGAIDLTRYGFGFYKSDGTGPLASGNELLKDGTTVTAGYTDAPAAEVASRDTRYVYDHATVFVGDVGQNMGAVAKVVIDGPKTTQTYWQREYYLTVDSRCETSSGGTFTCGNPQGEGYYNEGTTATFSVDSRVRDPAWMGTFGGFYRFDQWTGDSTSTSPADAITMNAARRVTATYVYNDQDAIRNIAILVAAGIIPPGILIWVLTHRRRRRPPPSPPMFPPGPFVPPPGMGPLPPGAFPPGAYPPGLGFPPGGQGGPTAGAPGFQPGPVPPRPPGIGPGGTVAPGSTGAGGTTGPGTGGPGSGSGQPGTGGPGTGPGAGQPGTGGPGTGGPGTGAGGGQPGTGGPGTGAPGTGGPGTGAGQPGGPGSGWGSGQGTGGSVGAGGPAGGTGGGAVRPPGLEIGAAVATAGVAGTAVGAVALARRRRDKCVWCEAKIKHDEILCPRCGVHQECVTCGTPLYKTSIVSKGYSANPEDQGLFCDRCNTFTS